MVAQGMALAHAAATEAIHDQAGVGREGGHQGAGAAARLGFGEAIGHQGGGGQGHAAQAADALQGLAGGLLLGKQHGHLLLLQVG